MSPWQFQTNMWSNPIKLPGFDRLLTSWLLVQQEYCAFVPPEHPWGYSERPCIGFLAAAAFRAGGVALEEWRTEKFQQDERYPGRSDLWIRLTPQSDAEDYSFEAKHGRISFKAELERSRKWAHDLLGQAAEDSVKNCHDTCKKVGVAFLSLYFQSGEDSKRVEELVSAIREERKVDATAGIWLSPESFSDLQKQRSDDSTGGMLCLFRIHDNS